MASALVLGSCGSDDAAPLPTTAPSIGTESAVVSLTIAKEAPAITFANTGGAIGSCSVEPALPEGLSLDARSCQITGTPTTALPQIQSYAITATNIIGSSLARIGISVNKSDPLPPNTASQNFAFELSADNPDPGPFNLPLNAEVLVTKAPRTIAPNLQSGGILFVNTSTSSISACSITPGLPSGLRLVSNPFYCLIEGAPRLPSPRTTYTVTAVALVERTDASGEAGSSTQSGQASIEIQIPVNATPPKLADRGEVRLFVNSRTNLPIVFANLGEPLNAIEPSEASGREPRCFISPNETNEAQAAVMNPVPGFIYLPGGWMSELTPVGTTCQLNIANGGLPAIMADGTGNVPDSISYRVRVTGLNADDRGGDALAIVTIVNAAPPPINLSPALITPGNSVVLSQGNTFNLPIEFANSGGSVTECYVDQTVGRPNLPQGLSVGIAEVGGLSSCVIAGTPQDVLFQSETYVVVGGNSTGFSSASIDLRVEPLRPRFVNEITITATNPVEFTVPAEVQTQILSAGEMLSVNLVNAGGAANYCRLLSSVGSTVDFIHPDFTAALGNNGASCSVTGAAPAPQGGAENQTHRLYVEIGNRYLQRSTYELRVQVNAAAGN